MHASLAAAPLTSRQDLSFVKKVAGSLDVLPRHSIKRILSHLEHEPLSRVSPPGVRPVGNASLPDSLDVAFRRRGMPHRLQLLGNLAEAQAEVAVSVDLTEGLVAVQEVRVRLGDPGRCHEVLGEREIVRWV